jgi:hypothetical protein
MDREPRWAGSVRGTGIVAGRSTRSLAVMADRVAIDDDEVESRRKIVALAMDMLKGRLSYFEGAVQLLALQHRVGGVGDRDPDFDAFVVIESETDHLPHRAQQHLWSAAALERHAPDIAHTEKWAADFAPDACKNIIGRFSPHDS